MSLKSGYIITCLWIGSILVYTYDYILGMAVLAFLSVLHVLLEFPLNAHSFRFLAYHFFVRR